MSDMFDNIKPPLPPSEVWTYVTAGVVAAVALTTLTITFAFQAADKSAASAARAELVSAPVTPSCKNNWMYCQDNEDMVENYFPLYKAQSACEWETKKLANFGSPQFNWGAFGGYAKGDDYKKLGKVLLIDDDVKFQNGFGAYQRTKIYCVYNLRTSKVESVTTQ